MSQFLGKNRGSRTLGSPVARRQGWQTALRRMYSVASSRRRSSPIFLTRSGRSCAQSRSSEAQLRTPPASRERHQIQRERESSNGKKRLVLVVSSRDDGGGGSSDSGGADSSRLLPEANHGDDLDG
jgi:hypothetical protein